MKRFLAGAFSLLLALGAGIRIWYVNTMWTRGLLLRKQRSIKWGNGWSWRAIFSSALKNTQTATLSRWESVEFMTPEEYAGKYDLDLEMFRMGQRGRCRRLWRI